MRGIIIMNDWMREKWFGSQSTIFILCHNRNPGIDVDKFGTERYRPLKDFWLDLTAKDLCASDVANWEIGNIWNHIGSTADSLDLQQLWMSLIWQESLLHMSGGKPLRLADSTVGRPSGMTPVRDDHVIPPRNVAQILCKKWEHDGACLFSPALAAILWPWHRKLANSWLHQGQSKVDQMYSTLLRSISAIESCQCL